MQVTRDGWLEVHRRGPRFAVNASSNRDADAVMTLMTQPDPLTPELLQPLHYSCSKRGLSNGDARQQGTEQPSWLQQTDLQAGTEIKI